ncbi:MAG: trimethylamine methyltransferase family protein [bacterium]|nr:trimethylamine methyltransferase family protein [bacterium]MDE0290215.1 trimethylamine methyltransferase family protein [bacterium]MDE0376942.1 trimethylamine methyltransferase family protein [bacterium]
MAARRRRGGRRARVAKRGPSNPQRAFRQPRLPWEPVRAVSADELEAIHEASLKVLRDVGMDILHHDARAMLRREGAEVDPDSARVRFDPGMITELVGCAPGGFTLHARNPSHHVHLGGRSVAFTAVASPPNVSGLGRDRRAGNREDFRQLIRLSQHLNVVHLHGGYPVEPTDVHPSVRHLHATFDLLTLSDKAIHTYSLGRQRTLDTIEMARIARGIHEDDLDTQPSIYTIVNTSSPLRLDTPMIEGILELSIRNQPVVITPFTLAGAMAPVTIAGALVQQNAEALAGIALTQAVRRGAPVAYGGFTSNVDMQSGAPAFGTPEYLQAALIGGQLARRYRLPYRSSNANASNAVDLQATYESMFSLWGAVMGGANLILHAAGWLEGGLRASFEKMVLDADLLQMICAALEPPVTDEGALALEAIADVGPGGHFFGTAHTQARYREAFHAPLLSDWSNFESWEEAGRPDPAQRTVSLARKFLDDYEQPPMEPAVREELEEFVGRRVAEGGVATDY